MTPCRFVRLLWRTFTPSGLRDSARLRELMASGQVGTDEADEIVERLKVWYGGRETS